MKWKLVFFAVFFVGGVSMFYVPIDKTVYWKSIHFGPPPIHLCYVTYDQIMKDSAWLVYWALFYPCILLIESVVINNTKLRSHKKVIIILMIVQSLLVIIGALTIPLLYLFDQALPGMYFIVTICMVYGLLGIAMAFPKFRLRKILFSQS